MRDVSILIMVIVLLFAANSLIMTANASITPSPPVVYDVEGNMLDQITMGHQATLSQSFANNKNVPQSLIALFEVRDSSGVTVYLAWQNSVMPPSSTANVGVSWIADVGIGQYEIRTFAISNFTNTLVLSNVEKRSIPVVEHAD
jgi:hypothetical protein